eukprot:5197117-Amphidinium_carterae.1
MRVDWLYEVLADVSILKAALFFPILVTRALSGWPENKQQLWVEVRIFWMCQTEHSSEMIPNIKTGSGWSQNFCILALTVVLLAH